ncbi:phytoene/squalene synthase family protein [Luteolibacter sp. Populi]|uniref:phytoene/squalene synthase family protein n=1 Tax=Luteolibacter sp. Populi TaxID=3230487 RepID=UPI0034663A64
MDRIDRQVLKSVSRSFYLSLRALPQPMRPATGTGYLLARASDTIADTPGIPVDDRLELLDAFGARIAGKDSLWRRDKLKNFIALQDNDAERVLLERLDEAFDQLTALDALQADAVRDVVTTIIGGQRLDLVRFDDAKKSLPKALRTEDELEDYCYRVAGCVGGFWTRIGFLTLGERFSDSLPEDLDALGVRYGMGLQLVNILRDLPEDLANGRCYLPLADPRDPEALAAARRDWLAHASVWLESGRRYASRLKLRRLRAASVLPALIGEDTIALLAAAEPLPSQKLKVTRAAVKRSLWKALWWPRKA